MPEVHSLDAECPCLSPPKIEFMSTRRNTYDFQVKFMYVSKDKTPDKSEALVIRDILEICNFLM